MSEQRARIARYVSATPGVHFNALVRELSLAPGQALPPPSALKGA